MQNSWTERQGESRSCPATQRTCQEGKTVTVWVHLKEAVNVKVSKAKTS